MSLSTQQKLEQALQQLDPIQLQITDDSHLHAGHAGNTGGGHFTVFIVSDAFAGLSLIKRHRLVYDAAAELLPSAIHALSIQAKTPDELK
ncbi:MULTISPECIES: BolA family protein [unclassified Methylophaga]|uniref:BolA family protein n=1 Tax=unclassified Methylophaga TaxID=2629249 RepID=UPI000C0FF242|nr:MULTISPECIES: BolA family protein [unclassified Methylophaga]MAM29040.1 transcriptional regulator [Flavobacteriaceae bacterium]MAL50729.1 transcriptional regulator [Methylophaga sp.]MBL1456562.1 BolA family transcriptional regulator [Methylophaga sp.]MBP23976.1 transcriptional regulator [Methylophaga sp.]HAD32665.1 transcriptional regulator [Methylophaga sp.]